TQAVHDHQAVSVAISDCEGTVLGVFVMTGAPRFAKPAPDEINSLQPNGDLAAVTAIEKARTAAVLSSEQNALSTRTGKTMVLDHFPPGVANQPPGPLFQLQFSQLPCREVPNVVLPPGNGVTGAFGGIPLYKKHKIAGGIGVDGATTGSENEL